MELLNRARKINAMLQTSTGKSVNFNDMSATLREVIKGNIFILSRRGKLVGFAINQEIENDRMKGMLEERRFPEEYTQGLFTIHETTANLDIDSPYTVFPVENRDLFQSGLTTIVPIIGGGERLGTLILGTLEDEFNEDDLLLAEYGATVVGMEILQEKSAEIDRKSTRLNSSHVAISYAVCCLKNKR